MEKEKQHSKWESYTSLSDIETQNNGPAIRFDHSTRFDNDSSNQQRRPSLLTRKSSISSLDISISRKVVEPNVVLPPIFKTVSYKVDSSPLESRTKLDKNVKSFKENKWHSQTVEEVVKYFHSNSTFGLTDSQSQINLKIYGANVHSPPKTNWLLKTFLYFFGGFGPLLFVGGVLCIICWKPLGNPDPVVANLVLGVVLFMVLLLQAIFNFWQDFSSSRVMNSINSMLPDDVNVIRNGISVTKHSSEIVPGDVLFISNGDRLPADVRFVKVEGNDFSMDRSILTGESKPIFSTANPDSIGSNYLESASIGLQGTFCVGGSGYGIVVATGDNTVFGQIAKLSSEPKHGMTPLQREIFRFVVIIVSIVLMMIVLVCILWGAWIRKDYPDWINTPTLIVDLVSISVAFIPEGLPVALTMCLIITAGAMKKNKILCKSLSVVETLGAVSTICSDKTGTLTKNKMFVTSYAVGDEIIDGDELKPNFKGLKQLTLISKLCNAATFASDSTSIKGNATDQAILRFGYELDDSDVSHEWHQKAEISFNSKNKFMIRLFQRCEAPKDELKLMIKGAPDILLPRCSSFMNKNGEIQNLTSETITKIETIQKTWAKSGQRVVLLAYKQIQDSLFCEVGFQSKESNDQIIDLSGNGLILVGLVGITDPPKDDIFDVINILKGAGIKVCMVTGDFELTALAIAQQCNIISSNLNIHTVENLDKSYPIVDPKLVKLWNREVISNTLSVTGDKIDGLNDNQWEQLVSYDEIVFSRTTPEQKLKIVENFQKRGHIVGMTGDGVNDAPSLKQADVGIAMSEGSDIAKEASDLVLLDSFSSMVMALKYGRLVFENLKKTIAYLLPAGCFAELWTVLLNVIFGLPQVLSSFTMIIICCFTDCAGAITLAYEAPEKNLLQKSPRSLTGERLVDYKLIFHSYLTLGPIYTFAAMMMSFIYFQEHGIPFSVLSLSYGEYPDGYDSDRVDFVLRTASSVYFVTLVLMQFFNLMATRTRYLSVFQQQPIFNPETRNYALFCAMGFALCVTFIFNYIPWFQKNLSTGIVPVKYYFVAIGFGCFILCYDELRKLYVRKHPKSFLAKIAW